MAKILCVADELKGLLFSSLELCRRLRAAGHDVVLASTPKVRDFAVQNEVPFAELTFDDFELFRRKDEQQSRGQRRREMASRIQEAMQAMEPGEFLTLLHSFDPDLVLIDAELHETILAATAKGYPVAILNSFVSIWKHADVPPPHHAVVPGKGLLGSTPAIASLWLLLRARKRMRARRLRKTGMGCDRISILSALCARWGLDLAKETTTEHWPIPFTSSHLPALSLHAVEFEFPHHPLERVHYVGPLLLKKRSSFHEAERSDEGSQLETLLSKHRTGSKQSSRLIYAGFGSFFSVRSDLVRSIVEAFRARPEWDLVLSLGGKGSPEHLGDLPSNVLALSWAPQLDILKHADVAITHGTVNTIEECITSGVPTLNYCGGATDMAGGTARAEYHGVGITGDPAKDSAAILQNHIETLLQDPTYRENVNRLRASYQRYEEQNLAVRTVEGLLTSGSDRIEGEGLDSSRATRNTPENEERRNKACPT